MLQLSYQNLQEAFTKLLRYSYLYLKKISENQRFPDVFSDYRYEYLKKVAKVSLKFS